MTNCFNTLRRSQWHKKNHCISSLVAAKVRDILALLIHSTLPRFPLCSAAPCILNQPFLEGWNYAGFIGFHVHVLTRSVKPKNFWHWSQLEASDLSRQPVEYEELLTAPAGPAVGFQTSGALFSDYSLPCWVPWNSAHSGLWREVMRFQNLFNSAFYLLWNCLEVTSFYDPSFQGSKFPSPSVKPLCNCRWYIFQYCSEHMYSFM